MDRGRSGRDRKLNKAESLSGKIVVPFAPESVLSGIGDVDFIAAVWYRKSVTIPSDWAGKRVLLHVGACDFNSWVYIDGVEVASHAGGYTPFTVDITDHALAGDAAVITIAAEDDNRRGAQAKGKQSSSFQSQGCDYTRTTGIWQTVWLEAVPQTYLESAKYTSNIEADGVLVQVQLGGSLPASGTRVNVVAKADGDVVGDVTVHVSGTTAAVFVPLSDVRPWGVEHPFLYDVTLQLVDSQDDVIDTVESYFGLRTITVRGTVVEINGKPVFQRLILDQGFYPDGIYTAPSDDALKNDILLSQAMGYNGARLHQKVFEPRFLMWADRLGYILWGEAPDWGLNTGNADGYSAFVQSWVEEVERDYNHPAIVGWCLFNEHAPAGSPEHFRTIYKMVKAIDPTRPVIDASGYHHVVTDVYDVHDYEQDPVKFAKNHAYLTTGEGKLFLNFPDVIPTAAWKAGKPYWVSEFGGIRWVANEQFGDGWGYGTAPKSEKEFIERYKGLCDVLLDNPKMCAFCYTQLTDVEQEKNGLYTYDRKPKFDPKVIHAITSRKAAIEEE
jgi:beta-galactosidase/beta-glucuronidase